jgi:hypothetical protein
LLALAVALNLAELIMRKGKSLFAERRSQAPLPA